MNKKGNSKTDTSRKLDVYEMVTNRIIKHLENGLPPWRQTWGNVGLARNYTTGKVYRGINALLLNFTEHTIPCFISFRQANRLGGKIKKGAKSEQVVYFNVIYRDKNGRKVAKENIHTIPKGELQTYRFLKYSRVFNVADVEGVRFSFANFEILDNDKLERCEKLIQSIPNRPKFVERDGNRCYYSSSVDIINLPPINHFESSETYYNTFFHELIHSTGHEKRLNRKSFADSKEFGDRSYSEEELVAELGAAFLCCMTGIDRNPIVENSAAYIKGWLGVLRADKKFVFRASSAAQKAVDYLTENLEPCQ